MSLPDDLADIERSLAARRRPLPSENLRPRVLSAVADELSQSSDTATPHRLRKLTRHLLFASTLAAAVATTFTIWQFSNPPRPPLLSDTSNPEIVHLAPNGYVTTWRDCRQALAHSPDTLDQLLQQNAAKVHSPPPQTLPHTHTNLLAQIGDLK